MDAFRKQASKLREQVAKQQQAVLKQFSGRFGNDSVIADEAEIQYYQQLKRLYISTREAKHLQRDLARGVEDLIYASLKQMDIATKLADNCCRYGSENQSSDSSLARASLNFGTSHNMMEKERDNLHEILDSQVSEPLRTMIKGAPLEDARQLTRQYYRIRQEVEAQAAEVARRQLKSKEAGATAAGAAKLQNAESKLSTLKSNMLALGKEAIAAMMSVEVQQQRLTFERLVAMVDAERSYHQSVAAILDELYTAVAANGWSEGECNGKAGWFPSAYIERRDRAPESKVINSNANPS